MGRPIKRKFFGVKNVNDGLTYSDAGGEGVASLTPTAGSNYSKGLTATVAVSPIGGTRATVSSITTNGGGAITAAAVGTVGTGYDSAPAVTLVKPATVTTLATNATFTPDSANLRLTSTAGVYVGMFANIGSNPNTVITNVYSDGNVRANITFGTISANTPIAFDDRGTGGALTAVLAATTTTANTIQGNAWTTNGTTGTICDIVSQRSSRKYRVTNSVETAVCRLVPFYTGGPSAATVTSAGGPTAAGYMTIQATDSNGGTYWVTALDGRTATVTPGGTGTPGSQFGANAQPIWTSTGSAVNGTTVKIATNN